MFVQSLFLEYYNNEKPIQCYHSNPFPHFLIKLHPSGNAISYGKGPFVVGDLSPKRLYNHPNSTHSTPLGLTLPLLPQVSPVAIISLRSLLRFIFNPFGVGASGAHFPQVFLKAIISLRSLLRFIFNPFGVDFTTTTTTGCTCGYSYLTPLGLARRGAHFLVFVVGDLSPKTNNSLKR